MKSLKEILRVWGPPECSEWLQVAGRCFNKHRDYDLDDRGALIDDNAFYYRLWRSAAKTLYRKLAGVTLSIYTMSGTFN